MDLNAIFTIISTMGGLELIKWLYTRKLSARKESVNVDGLEDENKRKDVNWLEDRIEQRDGKIDALYGEVRRLEREKLELIQAKHVLELQLKESEMKKCEVRGCANREPKSGY